LLVGDQVRRYARHVLLPDVGGVGQARLLAATIVVDVTDPAARAAFDYLVAAGVGTIAVTADEAALAARAAARNPDVTVVRISDAHAAAPRLAIAPAPPGDLADDLVRGGAAATVLLHRLATLAV
jgi:hypothetical protein